MMTKNDYPNLSMNSQADIITTPPANRGRDCNLVITGFMGIGKSTVGKLLAESMARIFVDMDAVIEKEEQTTIKDIFETRGEAYFRRCETGLASKIAPLKSQVIATGGGTFLNWKNYELFIAYNACVVYLSASLEEILKRLSLNHSYRPPTGPCQDLRDLRPLLASRIGNEAKLRELFESRLTIYERIPFKVDTEGKMPHEVALRVLDLYSLFSKK